MKLSILFSLIFLLSTEHAAASWYRYTCSNSLGTVLLESGHNEDFAKFKYRIWETGEEKVLELGFSEIKVKYGKKHIITKTYDCYGNKEVFAAKATLSPEKEVDQNILKPIDESGKVKTDLICMEEVEGEGHGCPQIL